jgi:hypothetical protein
MQESAGATGAIARGLKRHANTPNPPPVSVEHPRHQLLALAPQGLVLPPLLLERVSKLVEVGEDKNASLVVLRRSRIEADREPSVPDLKF